MSVSICGWMESCLNEEARLPLSAPVQLTARSVRDGGWSALTRGIYLDAAPAAAENLRVTELNYHPRGVAPDADEKEEDAARFEFIELQNTSDGPIDLMGSVVHGRHHVSV